MKKIIALLLVALMLSTAVFAEDMILIAPNPNAAKRVTVEIAGPEGLLAQGTPIVGEDATVLSVVEEVLEAAGLTYAVTESPYGGYYITTIEGVSEGAYGGYEGWMYYVDGQSPQVNMSGCALTGGELVQIVYADFDLLVPIVETTRDGQGLVKLTLTADVTTYDENWNPTVVRQPIAGVKLTVENTEYVTGEDGSVLLSAAHSALDKVTLQADKKDELGLYAVLPLASGYTLDLSAVKQVMPFSDLEEGKWYTPYVLDMAQAGVVNGFEDGTFRPAGTVTRAQVANVLYKLSGGVPVNYLLPFSDVAEGQWYTEAVRWAASEKIVTGYEDGTFRPDAYVTRQDLAAMLMRYQQAAGIQLSQEGEAPAFQDNDQIASYAAEAVYVLQKAGVVNGTDGKFNPTATANRGELCKMVSAFVISD